MIPLTRKVGHLDRRVYVNPSLITFIEEVPIEGGDTKALIHFGIMHLAVEESPQQIAEKLHTTYTVHYPPLQPK